MPSKNQVIILIKNSKNKNTEVKISVKRDTFLVLSPRKECSTVITF